MTKLVSGMLLGVLAFGQDYYPRMKDGVWWNGANQVFVGQDAFIRNSDRKHEPEWQREFKSGAATLGYDYRDVTCDATNNTFTATNFQLQNNTAVQFKSSATLPTPFVGWKEARTKWYYAVNVTPANPYKDLGTFQLSDTFGGDPIDITDTGGNCGVSQSMSFAGWFSAITLDVPQVYRAVLDPGTDEFQTFDNAGNPIAHGLPTGGAGQGAFFTSTGTYPTGLNSYSAGDRDKRCVVPTADPTKFRTRKQTTAQACPTTFLPPNDTLMARCGHIPGDENAQCEPINGSTLPPDYMRMRVVSVQAGTLPPNLIYLEGNTIPWTFSTDVLSLPYTSTTFRIAAPGAGVVRATWDTSGGIFDITFRVMLDDYTDSGSGTLYVSNSNSAVWIKSMSHSPGGSDFTGMPRGTLMSWRIGSELAVVAGVGQASVTPAADTNNAYRYSRMVSQATEGTFTAYKTTMIFKVPAITTPGTYNVSIKLDQSTGNTTSADVNPKTFVIPIIAETLTPPTARPLTKADFTPIPGFTEWRDLMTSTNYGGAMDSTNAQNRRCPGTRESLAQVAIDMGDPGFSSQDQRIWYYDGDRAFMKIKDYLRKVEKTPDDTWANCAEHLSWDMAQDYKAGSTPPGYSYRTRGIYIMTGQGQRDRNVYRDVTRYIADVGVGTRGETFDFNMRETALNIDRRISNYLVTGQKDHILEIQMSTVIGWLVAQASQLPSRIFIQPFMGGMLQREMTWYYAVYHQDPRIPEATKRYADILWTWYNPTTKQILYNPEPIGPRCGNRCQQGIESTENNFSAPTFYFAWWFYGVGADRNAYRDRGDEMFSNATHDRLPLTGKEWGQFFYYAWDGECWRSGRCTPLTPQY